MTPHVFVAVAELIPAILLPSKFHIIDNSGPYLTVMFRIRRELVPQAQLETALPVDPPQAVLEVA